MAAADAKAKGNRLFSEKKYEQALACYTDAIGASPRAAVGFTNRALCRLKLAQWALAAEDCLAALQLEPTSVKAHFFRGQALVEMESFEEATVALKTAHELARDQRKNFGDDIMAAIRLAKKRRWSAVEEKRLSQESELQIFLAQLLADHKERQLADVDPTLSPEEAAAAVESVHRDHSDKKNKVDRLFQEADENRRRRDVPDYLCGKISFDLMTDPCITPSGITYNRKDIEEHLQRVGHFDPVTREALTQDQLTPNLAMKEVVDMFVAENGWVAEY